MSQRPGKLKMILTNRWIQYLAFWSVSFFILARYFSYDGTVQRIDLIYTALFHISLVFCVCVNSFWLIPRYFARRRYGAYSILLLFTIIAGTGLNIYTFRYLADWIFPDYYFISYYTWTDIIQFIMVYMGITTLLQLSRSWFREAEIKQQLAEIKQEQTEVELKALRAQINPHFLFNSLNHIYALAKRQAPETASAVLKLSDLLRYTIRNLNKPKVPLTKELNYIRQYVELYKSRVHHPERIQLHIHTDFDPGLTIPPLLLIVFIENCFKHGSIKKKGEKMIVSISFEKSTLILKTENTVDEQRQLPEESGGLGLDNVKRRLNLLYSNRHRLAIENKNGIFTINLTLELA